VLLELFSGIGAAGLAWGGPVAGAIDQSPYANTTYALNHGLRPKAWNLEAVTAAQLAAFGATRWWLSPPCQPYTVRGAGRDLEDRRARPLLRLLPILTEVRPPVVAMENVPGFAVSAMRGELRAALIGAGYTLRERLVCPTALGVPMRRQRYYLTARRDGDGRHRSELGGAASIAPTRPLGSFLDAEPDAASYIAEATVRAYGHSAHIVDADDPSAVATCFTSAYGRSPVRAGSYVRDVHGVRRFSPEEVLRLLGFPAAFRFPQGLPRPVRWNLAGNSLSLDAVRAALAEP